MGSPPRPGSGVGSLLVRPWLPPGGVGAEAATAGLSTVRDLSSFGVRALFGESVCLPLLALPSAVAVASRSRASPVDEGAEAPAPALTDAREALLPPSCRFSLTIALTLRSRAGPGACVWAGEAGCPDARACVFAGPVPGCAGEGADAGSNDTCTNKKAKGTRVPAASNKGSVRKPGRRLRT